MIYLDHGATSFPKAPGVTRAMTRFLDEASGNPGRGGHRLTIAASRAIEEARESVADLLDSDPERTLFGPGATFWLNTILADRFKNGGKVVTSALEHNAVMRPLRRLEVNNGVTIEIVHGADPTGIPSPEEFRRAVEHAPANLVIVTHASNVTGLILPVEEIARAVAPVPVVVDGAQTAGSIPFSFRESGLSAFVCSGHKGLLGPPGTGALLLSPNFDIEPLVRGGTGSRSESEEMPVFLPDGLEAGTPNGPGLAGLGAACNWLKDRTVEAVADHERHLVRYCLEGLQALPGVRIAGAERESPRTGVISFTVEGRDTGELAASLDREHGIALRAGLHCAPAAHRRIGTFPEGTLRVGFGPMNSLNDVEELIAAVRDVSSP